MRPSVYTKEDGDEGSLRGARRQGESHLGLLISTGRERGGPRAKSLIALIHMATFFLWQWMLGSLFSYDIKFPLEIYLFKEEIRKKRIGFNVGDWDWRPWQTS